jgi:hypothetical protein
MAKHTTINKLREGWKREKCGAVEQHGKRQ